MFFGPRAVCVVTAAAAADRRMLLPALLLRCVLNVHGVCRRQQDLKKEKRESFE